MSSLDERLTFSMEGGERVLTAENDGDIVRITIRGEKDGPHEYYYLDMQEASRLHALIGKYIEQHVHEQ